MKKKMTALIMAAAMAAAPAATALAASEQAENLTESVSVTQDIAKEAEAAEAAVDKAADGSGYGWETDIRMKITKEDELMREEGLTLDEWDNAVSQMKQEGLDLAVTEETILSADQEARILKSGDRVYQINAPKAFSPIRNALDAYRTAYSVVRIFGGNELLNLQLWSKLEMNDTIVYSFQQISDSEMVGGSVIKIAVDQDGNVSAVFGGLDPENPGKEEKVLTREQIEEKADQHLRGEGVETGILSQYSQRISRYPERIGKALNLDEQSDEFIPDQIMWVVYSENTSDGAEQYPYLAHYLLLDGSYQFDLPVREPGDRDSLSGCRIKDVFAGMEADTWTGEITNLNKEAETVTIPVMKSELDGTYFLGDPGRRIAVADFAEAVYGEDHEFRLVSSESGNDWDPEDVFLYYNYIRAWDFYADMGWVGPDGQGTDVMILKDMCTSDGTLYENACSIGLLEGYQMFGYTAYSSDGSALGLVQSLDVLGHEFTHTFTSTMMNCNLYENDLGAINEAMSDIMGNLIEYICADTDDTKWLLGENTGMVIRSMSNPEDYQQPWYVWGENYGPHTDNPNETNDRGGVHINSSLLNRIAALLCMDEGMSYTDAVRFWTMAAMGMTPRTDYVQMEGLLNWAIEQTGLTAYENGLGRLIREEHLDRTEVPDRLPADQKIVRLKVPNTEAFRDGGWSLIAIQLNTETVGELGGTLFDLLVNAFIGDPEDTQEIGAILQELAKNLRLDETKLTLDHLETDDEVVEALTGIGILSLQKLLKQKMTWEENDTGEMVMVTDQDPTLYVLIHTKKSGTEMDGLAVLIGRRWYDISRFAKVGTLIMDEAGEGSGIDEDEIRRAAAELIEDILTDLFEEKQEEESVQEEQEVDITYILDTVLGAAEYFLGDEENKPSLEEIFALPATTEYLPDAGLDALTLN